MASLTKSLNRAVGLLTQGEWRAAERLLRAALRQRPDHADTLHLLAVAVFQLGGLAEACELAKSAVAANAGPADYWNNLGRYLFAAKEYNEAAVAVENALARNPAHAAAHLNLGLIRAAQQRLEEAAVHFREYVRRAPSDPQGHHNLGSALADLFRAAEALPHFEKALELKPDSPETLNNLGNALQALGRAAESIPLYERALSLRPLYPDAESNLGAALQTMGRFDEARAHLERSLAASPDNPCALGNLANLLAAERRFEAAVDLYQKVLARQPDCPQTHNNLGNAYQEVGRYSDASACYERALALSPGYFPVHNNLGNTLRRQGRLEEAVSQYKRALEANPAFPEALNNLGVALNELGRTDESIAYYEKAMAARPNYADPLINLANVSRDHGRPEQAIGHLRRALEMQPANPYVWNNLGCCLGDQGLVAESLECYRKVLELQPDNWQAHSNLLLNMHYQAHSPDQMFAAHQEFARRHVVPLRDEAVPFLNSAVPNRALRVGYVSADFRRHSVAFFVEPILENHSSQVEFYCYSDVARPDRLTAKFQSIAGNRWRDVRGMTAARFREQVRADRIDILVDLGGHTANSRVLSFSLRCAPVQLTYLGYPDTTGIGPMDFRLTDSLADPPGETDRFCTETLVRLDPTFLCYRPPADAPSVGPPPHLACGIFTFGSFNNMAKITEEMIGIWSGILRLVPGSRIALKNKALAEGPARLRLIEAFGRQGIVPERVVMSGLTDSLAGHLGSYGQIDVSLDTFPYHGTTTTCESLWMGVPVVSMIGDTHVSRVGLTLLSSTGLEELAAREPEEYIATACRLARETQRLTALRAGMRDRVSRSPLVDERRFVARLEAVYRELWTRRGNPQLHQEAALA